jgi:membrane-bound ClpP family serine protease
MTDTLTLLLVAVFTVFIILLLINRMIQVVQPGQIGLVYIQGTFRVAIRPGLNLVSPIAIVQRVRVGDGPNGSLGMVGTAETNLAPDTPAGLIRLGDRTLSARSDWPVSAGTVIRVIQDAEPGLVIVTRDRVPWGAEPTKPAPPTPLRPNP